MRYVIIGASAAGCQAAEELRKIDEKSDIIIVSSEKDTPYSRCLISRFVDGRLEEKGLYFKTAHYFKDNNIENIHGEKVTKIDSKSKKITTDKGKDISYDKLLIATGSRPFAPQSLCSGLEGVVSFHSINDARYIKEKARSAKKAVVAGAGFAGLEAAYALAKLGLSVTVIEKCSQILPNQMDATAAKMIQQDLEDTGVEIVLDQSISAINGTGSVKSVTLSDSTQTRCDIVVLSTGVVPNKELAKEAGIETERGILVDEFLETSAPDVYAAGDVIEINDVSTGKRSSSATWYNAVLQGKYAAYNMAGKRIRLTNSIGIQNAVQFHRLPAISFGKTQIDTENTQDYEVVSVQRGKMYKKLVLQGDKICGMIFVGDIERSGFYAALIRFGVDISRERDILLTPNLSYANFRDENFGQRSPYIK